MGPGGGPGGGFNRQDAACAGAHATFHPGAPQPVSSFPDVERKPNICFSSAAVATAAANVAAAVCFTEFLGAVPLEQRKEAEGEKPECFHVRLISAAQSRSTCCPSSKQIVPHLSVYFLLLIKLLL